MEDVVEIQFDRLLVFLIYKDIKRAHREENALK